LDGDRNLCSVLSQGAASGQASFNHSQAGSRSLPSQIQVGASTSVVFDDP